MGFLYESYGDMPELKVKMLNISAEKATAKTWKTQRIFLYDQIREVRMNLPEVLALANGSWWQRFSYSWIDMERAAVAENDIERISEDSNEYEEAIDKKITLITNFLY